jgi:hypothetical protein
MNLFEPFRTRSASRDEETDRQRIERLTTMLSSVHDDIKREREGLSRRYEESRRDAGFALEALNERPSNSKLAQRLDQHSEAILKYEKRLQILETQTVLLKRLHDFVADFLVN